MPYSQEWKDEGVYINYFDNLTSKDLVESNSLLIGKREFEEIKYVIVNFNDVTNVEIDDRDVNANTAFAERVNPYNKYIKVALVSNNTTLRPLLEKYINGTSAILPHAQQEIFSNVSEAKTWISSEQLN